MTEALDWGTDHLEPPKKRSSLSRWILGCLGGCMFLAGAAAVALWFGGGKLHEYISGKLEDLQDPELQWPELARVLPFEEPRPDYAILKWFWPLQDIWQLEERGGDLIAYVVVWPERGSGASPGDVLLEPKLAPMFAAQADEFETVEARLTLQGRELPAARIRRLPRPAEEGEEPQEARRLPPGFADLEKLRGDGLVLDVTREGATDHVLVWLMRRSEGAGVTDEDARAALAPFLIGPDRR